MNYANIPAALKETAQWIIWKYGERDGKKTKLPLSCASGKIHDAHDPAIWVDFAGAKRAVKIHSAEGIGFVVTCEDPFTAGDLDHCRNAETGKIAEWAQNIIARMDTYTEVTPSGEGLRFFCAASLPDGGRKKGNVELYDTKKFLTVTGQVLDGFPAIVKERQAELHALHAEIFGEPETPRIFEPSLYVPENEILEKAFAASNGGAIAALWAGDTDGNGGDDSAADMALVSHLAFYAGPSGQQTVDGLFRQSGLMRPKWDERHGAATYGALTIGKVYATMREFYETSDYVDLAQNRRTVNAENRTVNGQKPGISISKEGEKENCQRVNASAAKNEKAEEKGEKTPAAEEWPDIKTMRDNAMKAFPVHVLPDIIRAYVQNVADVQQVPIDLAAMTALATLSFCVSRRWDVQIMPSYWEPTCLYVAAAMEPGSRKSSCLQAMTFPLYDAEKILMAQEKEEITQRQALRDAQEGQIKRKQQAADRAEADVDRAELSREIAKLRDALPEIPALPRLIVEDVTPERLVGLLLEQAGTMILVSSEGGVFGTMGGRYNDGQSNLDVYLKGHDGEAYRVDRLNRPAEYLEATRLAICLTVQPNVLQSLTSKSEFRGRGLLGRFLYAIPADLRGKRLMQIDAQGVDADLRHDYSMALRALLMYPAQGLDNPCDRHRVKLSRAALAAHMEYANGIEVKQGESGELRPFSDWASKLAGRVARIAAILHCFEARNEVPHEKQISEMHIAAAWDIAEYLTDHAVRAFDMMSETDTYRNAEQILSWLKRVRYEKFTARECQRALQRRVPSSKLIGDALQSLSLNHYIKSDDQPNKSGKMVQIWQVNPSFWGKKPL